MTEKQPRLRRAFIIRLLVLLCLGAATTGAVSWNLASFALVQSANGRFIFDDGEHVWRVTSLDGIGAVLYRWMCFYRWKDSATPEHKAALIANLTRKDTNDLLGGWRTLPNSTPRPRLRQLRVEAAAQAPTTPQDTNIPTELREQISSVTMLPSSVDVYYGLPLPALRYTLEAYDSSKERSSGSLVLESFQVKTLPSLRPRALHLPLIPVPSGFAINTVLYASVWGVIYVAYFSFRRFRTRWRRQGRCGRCGYDLEFQFLKGCPECGWNRKPTDPSVIRSRNIRGFVWRLAAGILATIGVAWLAMYVEPRQQQKYSILDDGTYVWRMYEQSNRWLRVRDWSIDFRWREAATMQQRANLIESRLSPEHSLKYSLIPESLFRSRSARLHEMNARFGRVKRSETDPKSEWPPTFEYYGGFELIEWEAGWPALAMKSTGVWNGRSLVIEGAIVIDQKNGDRLDLPYHIIPLGFLLNTALITGALYLPRLGTSALQCVRRKRGRCPTCAIKLGMNASSGCTACGWNKSCAASPPSASAAATP